MKKMCTVALLVLMASLIGLACSDDDSVTGASVSTLAGKKWTRTETEGTDTRIQSYFFDANMTYTYSKTDSEGSNNSYQYIAGTWALEGGKLVTISTQYGNSSISMNDAISTSSMIELADRQKDEETGPIVVGNKMGTSSMVGGNTGSLIGVWGSLTSPGSKKFIMKDGVWTCAEEDFTKITLTATLTNYQTIEKRYYNDPNWLANPEYKNEATDSWNTTPVTNTFPITSWELIGTDKVKINIADGAMIMTNEFIRSGSAVSFDPYTIEVPN